MAKRPRIATDTETEVLTLSRRKCCLCYAFNRDQEQKQGQIAHLDGDRTNNRPDNLCWLCLPHHDQYDSRTSQSKGLTIHEVKAHRRALYDRLLTQDAEQTPAPSPAATLPNEPLLGLLTKAHDPLQPLSVVMTEVLAFAHLTGNAELEAFCRDELIGRGYEGGVADGPSPAPWRVARAYGCNLYRLKGDHPAIRTESAVFAFLDAHPDDFVPIFIDYDRSLMGIESDTASVTPTTTYVSFDMPRYLATGKSNHEKSPPIPIILRPSVYRELLTNIRRELIRRLMAILPRIQSAPALP